VPHYLHRWGHCTDAGEDKDGMIVMRVQGMLALPLLLVAAGVLVACDRVDETRGATAVVIGTTVAATTSAVGTAAPAATASAAAIATPPGTAAATPAASSTAPTPAQTAPPAATQAPASPAQTAPPAATQAPASAVAANVTLKEFAIAIEPNAIIAGQLSLTVRNSGAIPHEVVILKTDTNPRQLPISAGVVDETRYNVIGAVREVGAGAVKTGTFNLDAGKYVLLCNIAGHPVAGMYTAFVVK